ncbi:MAG: peptidase [Proteobacteria bacterium]|nr:peptidase [Pseudomonadota bacterium]
MNQRMLLTILVFSVLVGACASTLEQTEASRKEDLAREVKDENEIGRAMAAKLAGHLGMYRGPGADTLEHYVNLVGASLIPHSGRPEIRYRFGILASDEINAFATPGGYIFITIGLARELRGEDELAGVLGHEIAHITERHMSKEILPKREVSGGEILTRMLSRGGSDVAFSMSRIVNNGLEMLLVRGMGPEREHEADCDGALYAASAGYDPKALEAFLRRLQKIEDTKLVSKTHPPFPKRIIDLDRFLFENAAGSNKDSTHPEVLRARFERVALSIRNGKEPL